MTRIETTTDRINDSLNTRWARFCRVIMRGLPLSWRRNIIANRQARELKRLCDDMESTAHIRSRRWLADKLREDGMRNNIRLINKTSALKMPPSKYNPYESLAEVITRDPQDNA